MSELIRYQQLDNGLHEVIFLEKSRAGVDAFYAQMQAIYSKQSTASMIRLIVDLSMPGVIPLQYMYQESHNWRKRNPHNLPLRVIILYPEKGILPIVRVLINAVLQTRGNQIRLHLDSIVNREAALEWLMGDTP